MWWWHFGEKGAFAVGSPDLFVARRNELVLIFKRDQVLDLVEGEFEIVSEGADGFPDFILCFITKRVYLVIGASVDWRKRERSGPVENLVVEVGKLRTDFVCLVRIDGVSL